MEEFLKELGIEDKFEETTDDSLVLDIEDSNKYGKIYSKLDRSNLVYEVEGSSQLTIDTSSIQYENDDYILTLLADFENDEYKLTIRNKDN